MAGALIAPSLGSLSIFGVSASALATNVALSVGMGLAQRALTPDQTIKQEGARLETTKITSAAEGAPIQQLWGRARIGGQLIWATKFKEVISTSTQTQGGKGGPKAVTETTEYLYSVSCAIGLCEANGSVTLGRIWADGKLLDLSNFTYRFYDGSDTQLADPKIEAVEGVGTVPAYRGLAYIVFEDMQLADFGNRIPQITCEINRAANSASSDEMENTIRAVNVIPGAGEFIYGTEAYSTDDGEGNSIPENSHNSTGNTDFVASMDNLERLAPNVASTSLVVSWFGSSTDATTCEVRPKVDNASKTVTPTGWGVAGETRSTAQVVSQYDGVAAFGGTPSDHTVREAVIEMKARGLRVMFYPFLLMDMTDYPWRGRITGNPANFLGSAAPGEFSRDATGAVTYSGSAEWSHRRMILHYATLLGDLLESGDAFLVGSEMVGLSAAQSTWGTGLSTLMTDVRTKLASGVKVSYAADWSEYDEPHLAPAWTSADFIGIDWYLPLTDWRTSADEVYDRATFKAGMTSGEYWDYFYADEAARNAGTQTPITDDQYRQKNIDYWRDTNHSGKDIWLTEFGCPAVDKGANQPNVFVDAKSSESALPYFSEGTRNDTVQRLYIEAMLEYFGDNPTIVDPANMFVWTWDARPYPAFPSDSATWGDAENWATGHWITGRLGGGSVADVVLDQCAQIGIPASKVDVSALSTISTRVRGFTDPSLSSPSSRLENLMDTFLFDAYSDGEKIIFIDRAVSDLITVDMDDLIVTDGDDAFSMDRVKDTDLPDRTKVDFVDELRDYNTASVDSHTVSGYSRRVTSFTSLAVLGSDYARALADTQVHEKWINRNTISFTLPFSSESSGKVYFGNLLPGKSFRFPHNDRLYRIKSLVYGDGEIEVSATGYNPSVYEPVDHATGAATSDATITFGRSLVEFMDIPLRTADEPNQWSPRIAARQSPWPGQVLVYREDGSGGYNLNTTVPVQAVIGETTTALNSGPLWVWDDANTVTVRLYDPSESLSSLSDLSVLNGANAMLIETPSGEWEVFQFVNATLNPDGTYTLSRLLRGQMGTDAYMGDPTPATSRVVVYNADRLSSLSGTVANLGVDMALRYGPAGVLVGDDRFTNETVTPRGVAYRPYAPVQLTQVASGSDLGLSWVRRTRYDGDTWSVTEIPLNEEYEQYEVDILNGSTVVRTIVVDNAQTATYTAAQQTADFGSTQSSVSWVVYQISATFGRGAPAYG